MKIKIIFLATILFFSSFTGAPGLTAQEEQMKNQITLPKPQTSSKVSLEEAIQKRRSIRKFKKQDLTIEQVSQLLWAAQGITDKEKGLRAAPSAGAIYPLEIYIVKSDGLFHYIPDGHKVELINKKDLRDELKTACMGQNYVAETGVDIIIAAVFERIASRYGQRGRMYTYIEAGHVAQNVHLEAVSLGLGSVPIGAFSPEEVKKVLSLPEDQEVLYIIPVGYPR